METALAVLAFAVVTAAYVWCLRRFLLATDPKHPVDVRPSAVADPWPIVATTRQAAEAETTNIDPAIGRQCPECGAPTLPGEVAWCPHVGWRS